MIKKLSLISLFSLMPASFYYAQTTVFAYLKDNDGKPVERANVDLKGEGNDVTADKIGYFQFVDLKPGHYQIVISKSNYDSKVMEFDITTEKRKDLGVITMYSALTGADQGLAIIDSSGDEENSSQGSTVGLLQSSQDIFNRIASFDLGFYWFRPRGIDGRSGETMLNGISMVKADNGNVDYSNWGGLNEITRYPEIAANHAPSEYAFGGASSVLNKYTNASEYRKGFQAAYSLTNRNYRNRASLRYSSGMSKSGWAVTAMAARRWAQEGIQEGTFYDAWGGYIGVEKKLSDNHSITFNAIGAPYRRSTASPSTQEVFDLRGVHYNSYWGWQDGEKRSERVREGFQPILQLTDFWKINKKSSLTTSLSYQFGKDKSARLDWQSVTNPSPTYYRRLPSYFASMNPSVYTYDPTGAYVAAGDAYQTALKLWQDGDPTYTQLNWGAMYNANQNQAAVSQYGTTGRRALYFQVADVSNDKIWNANTHYTYNFNDKTRFILNLSYQNYRSDLYREVKDLLGADFAWNKDAFAATNQPGTSGLLNELDLENGGSVAKKVGDKIGYDYIFRRQEVKINPGIKFGTGKFDVFVSAMAGYSNSSREGLFKHYLYDDSLGKSGDQNFWNFGMKGQAVYKLNGRNFIVYNGTYFSQAPFLEDLYINPRLNASVAPNIKNSITNANDLSYVVSTPFLKLRMTGFWIDTQNETTVQRFFADGLSFDAEDAAKPIQSAFLTQVMSNVEKRNIGLEFGIDYKLTPTLSLQGLASIGQYTYKNDPSIYFASDVIGQFSNGLPYIDFGKANLKDYKIGGTPQQAFSLGFRYNSPKYWWFGANWNYLDQNYLDPSAILRSENFVQNSTSHTPNLNVTPEKLRELMAPQQLPSSFFLNANAGKSWMIGKYYVLVSGTINNILDNKKYITGGFEQSRNIKYDGFLQDYNREQSLFGPKYWYTQGRSYFVNVQFRF